MDDPALTLMQILGRLGAAAGLGGLLGLERELWGKPAGLRTHMLVALGSAAFTIVGMGVQARVMGTPGAQIDPGRIVEGVLTGIGFLGAGSIIRHQGSVEGLTTASAIWLMGAIGTACGVGEYLLAGLGTGIGLVVLSLFGLLEGPIEGRLKNGAPAGNGRPRRRPLGRGDDS